MLMTGKMVKLGQRFKIDSNEIDPPCFGSQILFERWTRDERSKVGRVALTLGSINCTRRVEDGSRTFR